jgi:hypothetical protein
MADYPFPTYEDYCDALKEALNSEFYAEEHPKYAEQHDIRGWLELDKSIILEFLDKGLNAQQGLNKFVQVLIESNRYARDLKDTLDIYIRLFLDRGAIPDTSSIIRPYYNTTNFSDLEDEVREYGIRGILIDILSQYTKVFGDINWSAIKETYYEDIIFMPNHKYDYETARLMALKYESTYLTSLGYLAGPVN